MTEGLTVVMYHYVREVGRSRYPALKALDVGRFRAQLRWATEHHTVVRMEQVLAALAGVEPLPPRPLLLGHPRYADGIGRHQATSSPAVTAQTIASPRMPRRRSAWSS